MMTFPDRYVIVDVETTGLDARLYRVIEVALAVVENDDWSKFAIETYRFELSDEDYRAGHPAAYAVNGYRQGHPDWKGAPECGSPEAADAWAEIHSKLRGAVLCNQNIPFDKKFIFHEIVRHRVTPHTQRALYAHDEEPDSAGIWERHHDEVITYSRKLADMVGKNRPNPKDAKKYNLTISYQDLKGHPLPPHRAEADVLRALWVLAWGLDQTRPDAEGAAEMYDRARRIREAVVGWISKHALTDKVEPTVEEAEAAAGLLQFVHNPSIVPPDTSAL